VRLMHVALLEQYGNTTLLIDGTSKLCEQA